MPIRRARRQPDALFDTLEGRQLLATVPPVVFQGTDGDGEQYTVTLKGGGNMQVTTFEGGGIDTITLSNTTANSQLSISVRVLKTGNGGVSVNAITSDSDLPLKSLVGPIDLVGSGIEFLSNIVLLRIRDVGNGADITLGGASTDTTSFEGRFISNTSTGGTSEFTFAAFVKSFKVATAFFVTVSAPSAGNILVTGWGAGNVRGNTDGFSLNLTDENASQSASQIKINGEVGGGTWTLAAGVEYVQVGSSDSDWTAEIDGHVERILCNGLLNGDVTALSFGTLRIRGLGAQIEATLDDPFGVGIEKVQVSAIAEGSLDAPNSGVGTITARTWVGGGLSTLRAQTIRVLAGDILDGDVLNVSIAISGVYDGPSLELLYVRGLARSSTVRIAGDVTKVDIGGANNFRFFAGVNSDVNTFPSSINDFALTGGVVQTFILRGSFKRNIFGNLVNQLSNFQIAGRVMGRVALVGAINFANSSAFGVASDRITTIYYDSPSGTRRTLNNLDLPGSGQSLTQGTFEVRVV